MGQIIFSTNDGLFSRGIRLLTKSKASHVAFQYDNKTLSHSTFIHGVSNENKSLFISKQKIVAVFEIKDIGFKSARKVNKKHKNDMYGYFDIIYNAITIMLKRVVRFKNPLQDGLICSEYVSLYIDACMSTKLNSSSYPPTPEDLLQWCRKNLSKTLY